MKNTEWKWVWVCLALALVFFVLAFVAGGLLDGMSSGYAMMLVFFFMLLCSLAVAGLFVMRARAMDEILAGKDLLAYWEYPADETARNAGREYAEYRAKNRLLLYFIGGLLVIAMILVVIFGEEDGVTTAGMLFVVLIIVAIASVVAPRFGYRKAIAAPREAYITDRGIIYAGTTYPFKSFLMRMTKVQFENATAKRPALLIFTFFQLVGLYVVPMPRSFDVAIPVPAGQEQKARAIAERLGGPAEQGGNPMVPERVCTSCGDTIKAGDTYCETCGTRVDATHAIAEQFVICPGCGNQVRPGAKFCNKCGYKMK